MIQPENQLVNRGKKRKNNSKKGSSSNWPKGPLIYAMMAPSECYIIAATPRTGSTLLCECLQSTGIAGRPSEFFLPSFRDQWKRRWSLRTNASFNTFLNAAMRHGTTENGVFGLKIHWITIAYLARCARISGSSEDVLKFLFPTAKYINIVRRDRRYQAISYYRALKTGRWWQIDGIGNNKQDGAEVVFNAESILSLERNLQKQQDAWSQFFMRHDIKPLVVEYELLAKNYRAQVRRVLKFLDLDESVAKLFPQPKLGRQFDAMSVDWRQLLDSGMPRIK